MSDELVQWIDADGTPLTLSVEWDTSERYMPPVVFEEDGVPQQPGMRLRDTRFDVRDFPLTLWMTASSDANLRILLRNYVVAMNPRRGPGKVRFTSPTGDVREITCSYKSGLGIVEKLGTTSGIQAQRATVVFRAHDPFYSDTSDISEMFTTSVIPNFFPIFPLRLSTSQVLIDTTINNNGDLDAWPVITIVGPGSVIKLTNLTTGLFMDFTVGTLGAGQSVIVDTRPKYKLATSMGVNVFPYLSSTSSLWPLVVGNNSIRLEMSGATAGVSQMTFAYRRRWLSV